MPPPTRRRIRSAASTALIALGTALAGRHAAAVKVQVRGKVVIDARAVSRGERLELRGVLKDDGGRPLGAGRLQASVRRDPTGAPLHLHRPAPCAPTVASQIHFAAGELVIDTDGAGAFCVVLTELERTGVILLEFAGDRFFERTTSVVAIDSARRSVVLSFSPEPKSLALERATHSIWVDTRVEPSEDLAPDPLQLTLLLEERDGSRRPLAKSAVRPGERGELEIKSRELGGPGPGSLVVQYAGSDALQAAQRASTVQKTARVALTVPGPIGAADPSDGVLIDVAVGSEVGAVPGGAVEAVVGGVSVGSAKVEAGAARVEARFTHPTSSSVPLTLRYLPDAPWWVAGEPVTVAVPISPPSAWRRVPWVIAAMLVTAWVVRAWRRPARTEKPDRERASLPPGRPSLHMVELGPARSGWRGRVLDAHEGTPIEGARVRILVPAFGGDGCATSALTAEDGRFELPHVDAAEGARLEVTARWHSTLGKALPAPGQIGINLVSRRRAVVGRLVDWANRMGRPWTLAGDPTPGHVARVADAREAHDVEDWANAVEKAAYGEEPPGAETEQEVRDLEPPWQGGG